MQPKLLTPHQIIQTLPRVPTQLPLPILSTSTIPTFEPLLSLLPALKHSTQHLLAMHNATSSASGRLHSQVDSLGGQVRVLEGALNVKEAALKEVEECMRKLREDRRREEGEVKQKSAEVVHFQVCANTSVCGYGGSWISTVCNVMIFKLFKQLVCFSKNIFFKCCVI